MSEFLGFFKKLSGECTAFLSEYARWWAPMVEDIVIDKNKGKKVASSQKPKQSDLQVRECFYASAIFNGGWGRI